MPDLTANTTKDPVPERAGTLLLDMAPLDGIAPGFTFPCPHGCELGRHAYCLNDCPDAPQAPGVPCRCGSPEACACTCAFCVKVERRRAEWAARLTAWHEEERRLAREWRAQFPCLAGLWDWTAQAAGSDDEWNRRRAVTMTQAAADLDAAMARRDQAEEAALSGACLDLEKRARARERRLGL